MPIKRHPLWFSLALSLPLQAQMTAQDVLVLAGNCFACHGSNGKSQTEIPSLSDRPASFLLQRMLAYKNAPATTEPASAMPLLMAGYEEAELRALAQWFAAHKE